MPDQFPAQEEYSNKEFQVNYSNLVEKQEGIINDIGERVGLAGY
jgi:hypothetical protein